MQKAISCVVATVLTMIAVVAYSQDPPAKLPAAGAEKETKGKTGAPPNDQPDPGIYCTLLLSDKLQTDLRVTDEQRAELAKLHDQLKATILNGGNRSLQHGPSASKARTLAKMTDARLTYVGKKVKDVLTAEQDGKLIAFYASGKLRPLEVAAAEAHDRAHGTRGSAFGEISLVPHYDDPAGKSSARSDSTTQGTVRGNRPGGGSYYRESLSPNRSTTAKPEKQEKSRWEEDIDTLLANLKNAGHDPSALLAALPPIEAMIPRSPNPAMAEALETVLLENSNGRVRVLAAKALENWGRPESIPALQKAAKSSDPSVVFAAKNAIKTLTDNSSTGTEVEKTVEKPVNRPAPTKRTEKSLASGDRDALLADIQSSDAKKRTFAALRLVGQKPLHADPEMAKALEHMLLKDTEPRIRSTAAWALQNWGLPETIPALKKALEDSNNMVQMHAKKAIDAISSRQ
jgi:hypothetical protein